MIAAEDLVKEQAYYLAGDYRPITRVYVSPYLSTPVDSYIFTDERKKLHRVYAFELTEYHKTEADCWRSIIKSLADALRAAHTHLYQLETNSQLKS